MNRIDLSNNCNRIFPIIMRMQAEQNGDADFLINDDHCITFAQADDITNKLAAGLQSLGVGKGDRVALLMGNRPELVLIALAANKIGALWTPINTDYKGEWLLDTVQRTRYKVLVTDSEYQQRISDIRHGLGEGRIVILSDDDIPALEDTHNYAELASHKAINKDYADQHYSDNCAILWTSGTTGKSKGVIQSYNCWIRAIVDGASKMFSSGPEDIIYNVLPLYNTAAWITAIYRALIDGMPCVIERKFSASQFMSRATQFGATETFAVGAMGVFLWNTPRQKDDADGSLRAAVITPMPPDLWTAFEERFGLKLLRLGFGMSECQAVLNQLEVREGVPYHSLGFPLKDIEVHVCDDDGKQVPLGEVGEMCIKPLQPHILFSGYFDDPEATAATYRGDWFLTGDLVKQDSTTGAFFFVDRKKDSVRYAGRNISSMEVESVVRKHPDIADVAAFGIPSKEINTEDELKINIVLNKDSKLREEDLCQFINDNAPHFFVPRYIDIVRDLPYTPNKRLQKFKLRQEGVTENTWDLKKSDYIVQR